MNNPFSLEDRTIVVTGASSGIGRECCIQLSRLGATIVLIGRNEDALIETLNKLDNPERHLIQVFDLNRTNEIDSLVSRVVSNKGRLDGVVNCAGISKVIPLNVLNVSQLHTFFETNVFAGYILAKEFAKKKNHNEAGGSIIFISSVMSMVGEKAKSLYCSTKGAINSLSKALACELAEKKIRVNVISPGVIVTPINKNADYITNPEMREKTENKHLLGLGTPEDVAYGCIYLLSDAARWITGQNLVIDGGYTAM